MTTIEIVRDHDGTYYANVTKNGEYINGLPEYVDYNTLKTAIADHTGVILPPAGCLHFEKLGRKSYSTVIEIK